MQSRGIRVLPAAAAVLGLGAVGTLALWSDSEIMSGQFRSVAFIVESAHAPDAGFAAHESPAEALPLNFDLPADGLNGETPVDAEIWFRMASATTGSLRVLAPTVENSELAGYIDILVSEGACGTSGKVLQQGRLDTLIDAPEPLTLPAGTAAAPGAAQGICIESRLGDTTSLPAGHHSTGRVEWEFLVTEEAG